MKIDASRALGAYAAVATCAAIWFALVGAAPGSTRQFEIIDVQRINVRETDGTLRMVIAGNDRIGGLIIGDTEYPHPGRTEAGVIFYNDEGTENGGLVFGGGLVNGRPTNTGHLSFDRWRQDQTLYFQSTEDGDRRRAGVFVLDRPDQPLDPSRAAEVQAMPDGPAKLEAAQAAGFGGSPRAFLGRDFDNSSQLVLRDAHGRPRLRLSVQANGAAAIEFLSENGAVTRTVSAS